MAKRKRTKIYTRRRRRAPAPAPAAPRRRRSSRRSSGGGWMKNLPGMIMAIFIVRTAINFTSNMVKKTMGSQYDQYADIIMPAVILFLEQRGLLKFAHVKEVATYMLAVGITDKVTGQIGLAPATTSGRLNYPASTTGRLVNYPARATGKLVDYGYNIAPMAGFQKLTNTDAGYKNLALLGA